MQFRNANSYTSKRRLFHIIVFFIVMVSANYLFFQSQSVSAVFAPNINTFFEWQIGAGCSDGVGSCEMTNQYAQIAGSTKSSCGGYPTSGTCSGSWGYSNATNTDTLYGYCYEDDWPSTDDTRNCTSGQIFDQYNKMYTQSGTFAYAGAVNSCSNTGGSSDCPVNYVRSTVRPFAETVTIAPVQPSPLVDYTATVDYPRTSAASTALWYCLNETSGDGSYDATSCPGTSYIASTSNGVSPTIALNNIPSGNWYVHVMGRTSTSRGRGIQAALVINNPALSSPIVEWIDGDNTANGISGTQFRFRVNYGSPDEAAFSGLFNANGNTLPPTSIVEIDTNNNGSADNFRTDASCTGALTSSIVMAPVSPTFGKAEYVTANGPRFTATSNLCYQSTAQKGAWRYRFRFISNTIAGGFGNNTTTSAWLPFNVAPVELQLVSGAHITLGDKASSLGTAVFGAWQTTVEADPNSTGRAINIQVKYRFKGASAITLPAPPAGGNVGAKAVGRVGGYPTAACSYYPRVEISIDDDARLLADRQSEDYCIALTTVTTTGNSFEVNLESGDVSLPFTNCLNGVPCTIADNPPSTHIGVGFKMHRYRVRFLLTGPSDAAGVFPAGTDKAMEDRRSGGDDGTGTSTNLTIDALTGIVLDPSATSSQRYLFIKKNPLVLQYATGTTYASDGSDSGKGISPNCFYGGFLQGSDANRLTNDPKKGTTNSVDPSCLGTDPPAEISPDVTLSIQVFDPDGIAPSQICRSTPCDDNTNSSVDLYGPTFSDKQAYVFAAIDLNDDGAISSSPIQNQYEVLPMTGCEVPRSNTGVCNNSDMACRWAKLGALCQRVIPGGIMRFMKSISFGAYDGILSYGFVVRPRYYTADSVTDTSLIVSSETPPVASAGNIFLGTNGTSNTTNLRVQIYNNVPFLTWAENYPTSDPCYSGADFGSGSGVSPDNLFAQNNAVEVDCNRGGQNFLFRVTFTDYDGFLPGTGRGTFNPVTGSFVPGDNTGGTQLSRLKFWIDLNNDGDFGDTNTAYPWTDIATSDNEEDSSSTATAMTIVANSTKDVTGAQCFGLSGVQSIFLYSGGTGYTSAPTVTITGSATGTANVTNGQVTSITLVSAGSGYTAPPPVSFSGGGGSGATAYTTLVGGNCIRETYERNVNVIYASYNRDGSLLQGTSLGGASGNAMVACGGSECQHYAPHKYQFRLFDDAASIDSVAGQHNEQQVWVVNNNPVIRACGKNFETTNTNNGFTTDLDFLAGFKPAANEYNTDYGAWNDDYVHPFDSARVQDGNPDSEDIYWADNAFLTAPGPTIDSTYNNDIFRFCIRYIDADRWEPVDTQTDCKQVTASSKGTCIAVNQLGNTNPGNEDWSAFKMNDLVTQKGETVDNDAGATFIAQAGEPNTGNSREGIVYVYQSQLPFPYKGTNYPVGASTAKMGIFKFYGVTGAGAITTNALFTDGSDLDPNGTNMDPQGENYAMVRVSPVVSAMYKWGGKTPYHNTNSPLLGWLIGNAAGQDIHYVYSAFAAQPAITKTPLTSNPAPGTNNDIWPLKSVYREYINNSVWIADPANTQTEWRDNPTRAVAYHKNWIKGTTITPTTKSNPMANQKYLGGSQTAGCLTGETGELYHMKGHGAGPYTAHITEGAGCGGFAAIIQSHPQQTDTDYHNLFTPAIHVNNTNANAGGIEIKWTSWGSFSFGWPGDSNKGTVPFNLSGSSQSYLFGYTGTVFRFAFIWWRPKTFYQPTEAGVGLDINRDGIYQDTEIAYYIYNDTAQNNPFAKFDSSEVSYGSEIGGNSTTSFFCDPLNVPGQEPNVDTDTTLVPCKPYTFYHNIDPGVLASVNEGDLLAYHYAVRVIDQKFPVARHSLTTDKANEIYIGPINEADPANSKINTPLMHSLKYVKPFDPWVVAKYRSPPSIEAFPIERRGVNRYVFKVRYLNPYQLPPSCSALDNLSCNDDDRGKGLGHTHILVDVNGNGIYEAEERFPMALVQSLSDAQTTFAGQNYIDFVFPNPNKEADGHVIPYGNKNELTYTFDMSEYKYDGTGNDRGLTTAPIIVKFQLKDYDDPIVVNNNYQRPGQVFRVKILVGRKVGGKIVDGKFSIRIFNVSGRLVFDGNGGWVDRDLRSQVDPLIWENKSNSGNDVGSGVYLVVMTREIDGKLEVFKEKKIVIVR